VIEQGHPVTVLMAVEQLRRRVPGGIGAYARGVLHGLAELDAAAPGSVPAVTLLASRHDRGDDPLDEFGDAVVTSPLPGRVMTRAWDRGLVHAPPSFDVVHSVSLAAPRPRRGSPARLVVTVHDLAWRRHPEATTRRGRRWHEAALGRARRADASMVVTSQLVAADLQSDGVDPRRITIARGGSDHLAPPDAAGATDALARLGVRGEYLLSVGTLEPRKNLERLVQAYAALRPSLPEPWALVVVGPAGWGPSALPPHGDGVVFAGAVPDPVLSELYRRARAFAYVPLTEGYGLPPLEAMRMGTPALVSTEVPSVHDLGDQAPFAAQVVDPLDIDDIAAGLHSVLTDDRLRSELVVRGTAHASTRTWRAAAEAHVALWSGGS
jgi:glycosyltransferase involved in cell wall biosynthesis